MKGFGPRFASPLRSARPRGARLIEAHSPKLGRRVRLFDHLAFSQWIRLEVDPAIENFCERPTRVDQRPDSCLIDFWVRRAGSEAMLLLESRYDLPVQDVDGVPVEVVPLAELAAARMWICNWARMLPVINATRALLPRTLIKSILGAVRGRCHWRVSNVIWPWAIRRSFAAPFSSCCVRAGSVRRH